MKRFLLGLTLLLSSFAIYAQKSTSFSGVITGLGDTIFVKSGSKVGAFTVNKNKFKFDVVFNTPTIINVSTSTFQPGKHRKLFNIVAVPGEKAKIKGDVNSGYSIKGSKFYKEYNDAFFLVYNANKKYEPAAKKDAAITEYIKNHSASESSAAIIPEMKGLSEMQNAVSMLSYEVKNGRMKPLYMQPINKLLAEKQAREIAEAEAAAKKKKKNQTKTFGKAPDFTLEDINGKPFTLSSLKGKYVLLEFWGSWCKWCRSGLPKMNEYYEKYKDKYVLVGIVCSDTKEKWKEAVKKENLDWTYHVFNDKGDRGVCLDYKSQSFPTKVLIDPNGYIIKKSVGEGIAFYNYLDKVFGGKN